MPVALEAATSGRSSRWRRVFEHPPPWPSKPQARQRERASTSARAWKRAEPVLQRHDQAAAVILALRAELRPAAAGPEAEDRVVEIEAEHLHRDVVTNVHGQRCVELRVRQEPV